MTLSVFRIQVMPKQQDNGRSHLHTAHQLGLIRLTACHPSRLYFLQGSLTPTQATHLAHHLLADPVTEQFEIREWRLDNPIPNTQYPISNLPFIEVTLLPGVTDPPAENILRAAHLLGITGLERAATGQSYQLEGALETADLSQLANELFANPVIQRYTINQPIEPPFFAYQTTDDTIETIAIQQATLEQLQEISTHRRLALNLAEMQAIQTYYRQEQRDPTDAELEMLAQTWSEHCVHKTFKATIEYTGPDGEQETIHGLLKTYIRAATEKINKPWVRSAFVDNAGIIAFTEGWDVAFKVETHNHPSALEPFGGANTGVGGVVRDVLGVSAKPIANTDILCFGPPDLPASQLPQGVLHPRRIAAGVTHGIEDYGNKMGIPTVNGAMVYHPGYTANPLVYCGCLGILPHGSHPNQAQAGDLIIAIGGRTGRDGLRGATFSSMEMDTATSEIAGTAVQIGHPIMEKQVQEVVLRARDEKLYTAITDCGAGGFSSAVGEMAQHLGAQVQLQAVTLKYPGLRPWEIWLSEAQERMVLAVPPVSWPRLQQICAGQDVEAIVLGEFTGNGRLHLLYGSKVAANLDMAFLHDGIPTRQLKAEWAVPSGQYSVNSEQSPVDSNPHSPFTIHHSPSTILSPSSLRSSLLALLSHPTIRSKEDVVRKYDHEVQGGTAVKPFIGVANHGPSDGTVIKPLIVEDSAIVNRQSSIVNPKALSLSNGICPSYGELDPYYMAWAAVDEAIRNAVAVGADPDQIAILDNFCWGNPNLPDRLGALVRCAQGCYDSAVFYGTPFISGKDSLNNEYTGEDGRKHAIPGTLLISALGIVPDVNKAMTMDLKQAGNFLFVVGETRAELGGSHYGLVGGPVQAHHNIPPRPVPDALERFRALHRAMQAGLVQTCHDCSEGGLAVALAEMCMAGRVGAEVQLMYAPRDEYWAYSADEAILFAETMSRFVVEVRPEDADQFRQMMQGHPHECVGVIGGDTLRINGRPLGEMAHGLTQINTDQEPLLSVKVTELEQAWRGHMGENLQLAILDLRLGRASAGNRQSSIVNRQSPRVLVLHANGTNRDHDAALACQLAGGEPEIVHINQLLAGERKLADYHMLVVPGGFSYGDDLGAGVLWALDVQHRFGEEVARFVENGRLVLGICNGFQTLVKAGLLPNLQSPISNLSRPATLTFNESAHFECRWVYLQPNPHSPCVFTQGLDELIYCPVAHGEGRLMAADETIAAAIQAQNLVALTYTNPMGGETAVSYPANPNGSLLNIAGLCNPAGNVLGLMPHPENHIFPWQHPRWRRGEGGMSGLRLFENGLRN